MKFDRLKLDFRADSKITNSLVEIQIISNPGNKCESTRLLDLQFFNWLQFGKNIILSRPAGGFPHSGYFPPESDRRWTQNTTFFEICQTTANLDEIFAHKRGLN